MLLLHKYIPTYAASDLGLDLGDFISCAKNLFHLFATRYLMHIVHIALVKSTTWAFNTADNCLLRKMNVFIHRGLNYIS